MISISIQAKGADETRAFLVSVQGELRRPTALHRALGQRLVRELKGHFQSRNKEPNSMGAAKTNFWKTVADFTTLANADAQGAVVSIAGNTHLHIHLTGGTIKPKRGTFLTIPLIPEARGQRAAEYERSSGHKLFRVGGVLMERTGEGDRSIVAASQPTMRTKSGYRVFNLGAQTRVRPVYALAKQAVIPKDLRALPPKEALASALQDAANAWAEREMKRKGKP